MSRQLLSEQEFCETLQHLVLSFSSVTNLDDLTTKEIEKAYTKMRGIFDDVRSSRASTLKPLVRKPLAMKSVAEKSVPRKPVSRKLTREEYKKIIDKYGLMGLYGSVSKQLFLCEFCVFRLKQRLKHFNSLTKPVVKARLMKQDPPPMDLNRMTTDVYAVITSQKEELKGIIDTEKSKVNFLKILNAKKRKTKKRKKKEDLKSLFFKKRAGLKASLLRKGNKNAECMLRAYELFALKLPSKAGRELQSQQEVADAIVEEGLTEKCSQQSISRWNATVERELKR